MGSLQPEDVIADYSTLNDDQVINYLSFYFILF